MKGDGWWKNYSTNPVLKPTFNPTFRKTEVTPIWKNNKEDPKEQSAMISSQYKGVKRDSKVSEDHHAPYS